MLCVLKERTLQIQSSGGHQRARRGIVSTWQRCAQDAVCAHRRENSPRPAASGGDDACTDVLNLLL